MSSAEPQEVTAMNTMRSISTPPGFVFLNGDGFEWRFVDVRKRACRTYMYMYKHNPRTPAPQQLERRGHGHQARVGLRGRDRQLEREAGEAQGGGEREGDGEPREAAEEVACRFVFVCCFWFFVEKDGGLWSGVGGWGWAWWFCTFDGRGGAGRDSGLPVALVDEPARVRLSKIFISNIRIK